MTDIEQQSFYEDFVRRLRARGVLCGITSGLACVHYGIAETTKDCDLLCHTQSFGSLLDLMSETRLEGVPSGYRGNISAPLDARWHCGGWTSHFQWDTLPDAVTLDVFGRALRETTPWEGELAGLYVSQHTVAEMKRTDRDKDWPFITSLGVNLLLARDMRGWLHVFDEETLLKMMETASIPREVLEARPVLQLAIERDVRLRPALLAERHFWQELDRLRIRIHRAAVRPFAHAMGRAGIPADADLGEQHRQRLACAEEHLKPNPIREHGLDRLIDEARQSMMAFVQPDLMKWLPDVRPCFNYLMT